MNESETENALLWLMGCAAEVVNICNEDGTGGNERLHEQIRLLEESLVPFKKTA